MPHLVPPNLPSLPRGNFTWTRNNSQAWIELSLQQAIVTFLKLFEDEHPWVRRGSMTVVERFSDTGITVRVPFGPTGPPQRKDNFLQRSGLPLAVISCERERDMRVFEVATSYPAGNDSPSDVQLAQARLSMRAQEFNTRS
ncbi:MAG: hypothetical protein O7G84_13855 [Gammaproteobacteria bacterium]|nr:hypothetical protein [Gammaproteobacteria bacterium]